MPESPPAVQSSTDSKRGLKLALLVGGSFSALILLVVVLLLRHVVTFQMALLMLVALLGLYVGLGVLYVVHRFVDTLD
jgi:hypothetical protein